MFRTTTAAIVCVLGLAFAGSASATPLEAKKKVVKIYKQASKKSPVVTTVQKGQPIVGKERKGMYWSVKSSDGSEGYVSVLSVKRATAEASSLSKAIRNATDSGRDSDEVGNARSRSAVMGVRGLGEDDDTKFAGEARPNLRAVYAMEDYRVTEKQLEAQGELVFAELEKLAEKAGN